MDVDNFIKKTNLRNKQREVDKLYENEGFTDEVLEKQIQINKERHEHDLPDENDFVYEKYVQ